MTKAEKWITTELEGSFNYEPARPIHKNVFGMNFLIDESLPDGVMEIRDSQNGRLLLCVVNIG